MILPVSSSHIAVHSKSIGEVVDETGHIPHVAAGERLKISSTMDKGAHMVVSLPSAKRKQMLTPKLPNPHGNEVQSGMGVVGCGELVGAIEMVGACVINDEGAGVSVGLAPMRVGAALGREEGEEVTSTGVGLCVGRLPCCSCRPQNEASSEFVLLRTLFVSILNKILWEWGCCGFISVDWKVGGSFLGFDGSLGPIES